MSEKKIKLKIVTPERTVYENEIDQVTLPVVDGQVTIMPDHLSYIAAIKSGELMLKRNGEEELLAVSTGLVEFSNNILMLLVDTAEIAEEIDLQRAEEAIKRAQEINITAAISKHIARIHVARKHLSRRGIKTSLR